MVGQHLLGKAPDYLNVQQKPYYLLDDEVIPYRIQVYSLRLYSAIVCIIIRFSYFFFLPLQKMNLKTRKRTTDVILK